jgi:hypothetical protein
VRTENQTYSRDSIAYLGRSIWEVPWPVLYRFAAEDSEEWSARRALQEAKYLHFLDWPYPKP